MAYLFGPVPSRRLGLSLGIDLVPYKVCSYNCIYCEVGETTDLTVKRREYVPLEEVKAELERFFSSGAHADHITFSGFGEPTLHSGLGELARWVKHHTNIPIALLTNSSLLWIPQVREELSAVDVALPSLDAVSQETFVKINRPHPSLDVERIVDGLIRFSHEFTGKIWLEILLVKGVNDSPGEVERLSRVVREIAPERIQLNTVVRPPAVGGTAPLSHMEMAEIAQMLPGEVEIVGSPTEHSASGAENLDNTVLETVKRRPCTIEDLVKVTGAKEPQVKGTVKMLILNGHLESHEVNGHIFYKGKASPS
jgi:wyosine [tRNA(Phe)-imidazoG37] synthetase (radical SAM superfamily)